ncbi:hypothetical protein EVAR_100506_1 [Eumeta japonica]|uniref:Uncharacterized protein n=1 Tax=Eumeta variegata TaxID=151549 RepID=A0A4C2A836_EUMVA|nr:hypothetical protein EVAR_100506_1 [Eumeta japonica]
MGLVDQSSSLPRIENLPESEQEAVLRLKQDRDREWNRNLFPSESNVAPQSRLEEIDFENGTGPERQRDGDADFDYVMGRYT